MHQKERWQIDEELYRKAVLATDTWRQRADHLLKAAAALEGDVADVWGRRLQAGANLNTLPSGSGVLEIHLMLVAYALENLFKAALVAIHRRELQQQLDQNARLPAELKTHSLVELAHLLAFDITLDQEVLLRRVTRAAVWSGRYPVPLGPKARSTRETLSTGDESPVAYNSPQDVGQLKGIIASIRQQFELN